MLEQDELLDDREATRFGPPAGRGGEGTGADRREAASGQFVAPSIQVGDGGQLRLLVHHELGDVRLQRPASDPAGRLGSTQDEAVGGQHDGLRGRSPVVPVGLVDHRYDGSGPHGAGPGQAAHG